MNRDPFNSFILFVKADGRVEKAHKELAHIAAQVDRINQERNNLAAKAQEAHMRAAQLGKTCDAHELEIRVVRDRLDVVRTTKTLAHTTKEFNAAQAEEERLMHAIDKAEDLLLACDADRHEAIQREAQAVQERIAYENETSVQLAQLEQLRVRYEHEKEEAEREREAFKVGAQAELLTDFAMRKSYVVNPVVPVINNACSACYNIVAAQDLIRMRRQVLVMCAQCYRMLFFDGI